jgi:hypothetical protein
MAGQHEFEIFVNNKPVFTSAHELTGSAIKQLAGVPPDYSLYLERGSTSTPVPNDTTVHINEKERFRAIPAPQFGEACFPPV